MRYVNEEMGIATAVTRRPDGSWRVVLLGLDNGARIVARGFPGLEAACAYAARVVGRAA